MFRRSSFAVMFGVAVAIVLGGSAQPAFAIKQFFDEFKAAYGNALAELLDKKEDAKNVDKIRESLEKVAAMPSDPAKADGPTFGALIEQGKLPGGPVQ